MFFVGIKQKFLMLVSLRCRELKGKQSDTEGTGVTVAAVNH
jgi:hypothetical protein